METQESKTGQQLTPIAFEILLALAKGPQHGYGIKLEVEERTNGALRLGSGTLYQAIQRLERAAFIEDVPSPTGETDARRGRFYQLRPAGREALTAELRRLSQVLDYARSHHLLTDAEPSL